MSEIKYQEQEENKKEVKQDEETNKEGKDCDR